jgi:hypothetical protein
MSLAGPELGRVHGHATDAQAIEQGGQAEAGGRARQPRGAPREHDRSPFAPARGHGHPFLPC